MLLMVVPWVLFAGAVATICVLVARRKSTWRRGGGQAAEHREGSRPGPARERD
jgi:hypothetical protein